MALVDFSCYNCGSIVPDKIVKDAQIATRECSDCGTTMYPKVATVGSFVLQGRRWARDGYK